MSHPRLPSTLRYGGKDATLINFTGTGSPDEYGDISLSENRTPTRVIVDREGRVGGSRLIRNVAGQEQRVMVTIFLSSDLDIYDGEGSSWPSNIEVDGQKYEVVLVDNIDDSITRTTCQRV